MQLSPAQQALLSLLGAAPLADAGAAPTATAPVAAKAAAASNRPEKGGLIWDSEGQDSGPYDSHRLHVPSDSSGLTIGRGYDMKGRSAASIEQDLVAAGVSAGQAKAICTKDDVAKTYGACDWDALDPAIRDMVVDLKYRGDYTPASRKLIQKAISANDLRKFTELMSDSTNWPDVPEDRFNRRKAFLSAAVAKAAAASTGKAAAADTATAAGAAAVH